jgi:hypothetical protein
LQSGTRPVYKGTKVVYYIYIERKPTMTNLKQLHQNYLTIVNLPGMSMHWKRKALCELVSDGGIPGGGWQVIGITADALQLIADQDYKKAKGCQRGHIHLRHEIYTNLIENPILDAQEWVDYIQEYTTTYLCTKAENGKHGTDHWSKMIPFTNQPSWLLECQKIGFSYRAKDREWIRNFHSNQA